MFQAVIAEKNEKVRQIAANILSGDLHADVHEVSKTEQFLKCVEEAHPELLLVGLDMVSEVGVGQVKKLRLRLPDMNVIFLVAVKPVGEEFRDLLTVGATDFLSKPFNSIQLLHRIRVLDAIRPLIGIKAKGAPKDPRTETLLRQLHDPKSGRINAKMVAAFLGLRLKVLAEGLGRNYRAVHKTPSSEALQTDLQTLRRIIELLLVLVGSKKTALIWMNTPSQDLAGETPAQLIKSGHADSVRSLLENVAAGAPS